MSKGFIDRVGGTLRFRWVKPGFNALNFATAPNAVIFDSAATDFLQVFASGTLLISNDSSGEYKPITWPSLGYIPFAWACFRKNGENTSPVPSLATSTYAPAAVSVEVDGIRVETRGLNYPVSLDYLVFRVPAI